MSKTLSTYKIGKLCEEKVNKKLISLGIKNRLTPHFFSYDIISSNGIRIEVKKATYDTSRDSWKAFLSEGVCKNKSKYEGKTKKHNNSIHYRKGNRYYKDYTKSCDFIIVYIKEKNIYYILPSHLSKGIGRFNLIPHRKSKYNKYINKFQLIKMFNNKMKEV